MKERLMTVPAPLEGYRSNTSYLRYLCVCEEVLEMAGLTEGVACWLVMPGAEKNIIEFVSWWEENDSTKQT